MLEKVPICHLILKLCLILLMEADFNCTNKIIYGRWMLVNAQKYGFMPDKIFSEVNQTAEEGSLAKGLFYDMVQQSNLLVGISSVDADNCYNCIAHATTSLVFCSFGVTNRQQELC